MKNLKNLKGIEGYGKMSITEDHTKAKRELIKKAKELNAKEPNESNISNWDESFMNITDITCRYVR